ncbi:hypothetical protein TNCV_3471291 [Trichonephila clavipes]|nr:hypothetical protein TNCV_3471291 [Trichonephila clavipes]
MLLELLEFIVKTIEVYEIIDIRILKSFIAVIQTPREEKQSQVRTAKPSNIEVSRSWGNMVLINGVMAKFGPPAKSRFRPQVLIYKWLGTWWRSGFGPPRILGSGDVGIVGVYITPLVLVRSHPDNLKLLHIFEFSSIDKSFVDMYTFSTLF